MPTLSDPVAHLLQIRRDRRHEAYPSFAMVLFCFGLPALLLGGLGSFVPHGSDEIGPMHIFIAAVGLSILLVLPMYACVSQISLLNSLRKGRCLEEMLATGISPIQMTDTLAVSGSDRLAVFAAKCWLVLIASLLVFKSSVSSAVALLLLSWPLAVPALVIWTSYVALAALMLFGSRQRAEFIFGFSALGLVLSFLGWLALGIPGLLAFLAGLLWLPWLSRRLVAADLASGKATQRSRSPRRFVRQQLFTLARWSENPIVSRELARQSSRQDSPAQMVLARIPNLFVPIALAVISVEFFGNLYQILYCCVPLFGLYHFLRAALRTLNAVTQEKQQKTWDSLVETGLSLVEFRSGWILLAVVPGSLEALPLAFFFGHCLVCLDTPLLTASLVSFLIWSTYCFAIQVGAQVGLTVSAQSQDYQRAGQWLLQLSFLAATAALGLWGAYSILGGMILDAMPRMVQEHWGSLTLTFLPWLSGMTMAGLLQIWADRKLFSSLGVDSKIPAVASNQWAPLLFGALVTIATVLNFWGQYVGFPVAMATVLASLFTCQLVCYGVRFLSTGTLEGERRRRGPVLSVLVGVLIGLPSTLLAWSRVGRTYFCRAPQIYEPYAGMLDFTLATSILIALVYLAFEVTLLRWLGDLRAARS